jgi:hypothetical protein
MESATRIDCVADRLRRDQVVAEQFLDWHRKTARPPRLGVLRAAAGYRQWCADARSELLHVDVGDPVDVDAFEQQWRLSAYASEIRAESGWVEACLPVIPLALATCIVTALTGSYVVSSVAGAIAIAAYSVLRKAKPALLVGPAGRPPPFWITGLGRR